MELPAGKRVAFLLGNGVCDAGQVCIYVHVSVDMPCLCLYKLNRSSFKRVVTVHSSFYSTEHFILLSLLVVNLVSFVHLRIVRIVDEVST